MSHVATVDLVFKDLEALKKVCEDLGLIWKENQKTYRWYGTWVRDYHAQDAAYKNGIDPKNYGKCEHAIGTKANGYEIGVCKNPNGDGYVLVWDFYDGTIEKVVGKQCHKLYQSYSKNVVMKKVKYKGYILKKEIVNDEGEVELEFVRY